jgi:hypothetical protein
MSYRISILAVGVITLMAGQNLLRAQGNAFLYEGALTDLGGPAQGDYDLRFRLYNAVEAGHQSGPDVTLAPVQVTDGRFTVTLDFGPGAFDGNPRWLELAVRSNNVPTAQAALTPRQRILPLPYAIHAGSASMVTSNGVNAAAIQNATLTANKLASNQVVKSFNGLRDNVELRAGANITLVTNEHALIIASTVFGGSNNVCCLDDWHVAGNLGTTAGVNFLGTLDNQALELKVNNERAFRLEPNANSPNVVGGFSGNAIIPVAGASIQGSVISGGGTVFEPTLGGPWPNVIRDSLANIGGGIGNEVRGALSTIGGGSFNLIEHSANRCVIAGGSDNLISSAGVTASAADFSTIGGGSENEIRDDSNGSTIGGGRLNLIEANVNFAAIGGGEQNRVAAHNTTLGGGQRNTIGSNAPFAAILGGLFNVNHGSTATLGGGRNNRIDRDSHYAVVAGGDANLVQASSLAATIAGGRNNLIRNNSLAAVIGGGNGNQIEMNNNHSTVAGGEGNRIGSSAIHSVISGGSANEVAADARFGVIGGGDNNEVHDDFGTIDGGGSNAIRPGATYAAIGGGAVNTVGTNSPHSVIGGGLQNNIALGASTSSIDGGINNAIRDLAYSSTIGGGAGNLVGGSSTHAVVAGGWNNAVSSVSGTISGGYQNSVGVNSPWSTIGGGQNNVVTNSQDATISGGTRNRITPGSAAATVSGGEENTASAVAATVPGGRQAHARVWGQQAYAGGRFAQNGDAQTSTFVVRGTTSDATPRELFLDGAGRRITVPLGGAWTFEAHVVGRSSSGESAGYKICGVIENNPHPTVPGQGLCVLVGGPAELAFEREDNPAWNATVEAELTEEALVVRVSGASGQSIRWVATVRTAEVIY